MKEEIWIKKPGTSAITIVRYKAFMLDEMLRLFYNTVHSVNAKDYDVDQLNTWAPLAIDKQKWEERLANNICLVTMQDDQILGFGELSNEGGIDSMYVHKNFQGKRIASNILDELTGFAQDHDLTTLSTDASITAKPFFESHGFIVVKEQRNHYRHIIFVNYKMQKDITNN